MRNMILLLVMVIALSGCRKMADMSDGTPVEWLFKPWPHGLDKDPPEGTPIFKAGWTQGCESGLASYGGSRYRRAYAFVQDMQLVNNPEYYRAWKDAYTYCRWYVWNWDRPWQQ